MPIEVIEAPEGFARAGFGLALCPLGDVDRDGVADFAVGGGGERVWVVSGATGQVLRTITSPLPTLAVETGFGSRLGNAGDIGGDGICEMLISAPGARGGDGEVFIFNARQWGSGALAAPASRGPPPRGGARLWRLRAVTGRCRRRRCRRPFGICSQLRRRPWQGLCVQRAQWRGFLENRLAGASGRSHFEFQDVTPGSPGDVDGDGRAELYVNGFRQSGRSGPDEGRAWVLDGLSGTPLYSLAAPEPISGGQFGWSMARADHNGDGIPRLYVGAAPHHLPGCDQNGGTWVFSGLDGTLLETLPLPEEWSQPASETNWGPNLGWSVASPGDLDGDGLPDYVAGAPFTDVDGRQDQGLVVVFLSSDVTS